MGKKSTRRNFMLIVSSVRFATLVAFAQGVVPMLRLRYFCELEDQV
jgi:hypothetical protein